MYKNLLKETYMSNKSILIYKNSQAAIKALDKLEVKSKLVADCINVCINIMDLLGTLASKTGIF